MISETPRMCGIWRRIVGFKRMLGDLWVAPPGGDSGVTLAARSATWRSPQVSWAITINCCAAGGDTFFGHPFLICYSCQSLLSKAKVSPKDLAMGKFRISYRELNSAAAEKPILPTCVQCAYDAQLHSWQTFVHHFRLIVY